MTIDSDPSTPRADAPNTPRPVTESDRYGYVPVHDETQACLGCGRTVTFDEDMGCWWIPYDVGNPPPYTFTCKNRTFSRHLGSVPRFDPSEVNSDPRLLLIADLIAYMDLHIGKHEMKQLTTEQKEMWADLVDSDAFWKSRQDPSYCEPGGVPPRTPRWWREDYDGPTDPIDPRWHSLDRHEPDPFRP